MPPAVFLVALLCGGALEYFLPPEALHAPRALRGAGIAVGALGFAFMMWGHGRFRKLGVNVMTVRPASRLVTDGAHRISRNPMYVGLLTLLAGIGLATASVWLGGMVVPLLAYFQFYVIPREEAYLARRFGTEYADYRRKVRRWL
jgi:protein-S-isoprenylcysteine O-methyltransferase Ste14